jgi:DNA-binding SARP family transcriptional activator
VDAPPAIGVARQDTEILHARLLGPVDLRVVGQRLAPLDSARAESLLAYLLLHRDAPQPRQRLAFLLKDAYDPANLFWLNHNIRPSHPARETALA